ncbi:hypothetical protein [Geoglobus ahangari]
MASAKMKHIASLLVMGILAGTANLAIMERLESIRSPSLLIVLLLITCAILTVLYYRVSGKRLASAGFLASLAIVSVISIATFTLILGFALMSEYSAYLFVEKVESASNCITLSEEDMSRMPFLKRALEKAEITGKVIVEIDASEVKALSGLYGRCVVYKGEGYLINVATT